MDPDEERGTPPRRRSRRIQHLHPTPETTNNAIANQPFDNSQTSEHASQYGTANLQIDPEPSDSSTITSVLILPPLPDNTINSIDPPEDPIDVHSNRTMSSQSSRQLQPPTSRNPPNNISIFPAYSPTLTPPSATQNQTPSNSTITAISQHAMMEDYVKLQTTVTQMQQNMNTINLNMQHLDTKTNEIQSTLDNVNNHLQTNITTAVMEAMRQFQAITTENTSNLQHSINTTSTTVPTTNQTIPDPQSTTSSYSSHQRITNTPTSTPPSQSQFTIDDLINITTSTKCAFPIYTKNQNVYEWKTSCILELATSNKPIHKQMITYDTNGDPRIRDSLNRQESQELFRLTKNALSTKLNTKFITVEILKKADGNLLLEMVIQQFRPINKDAIELSDMTTKFTSFVKQPGETDDAYIQRFDNTVAEMDFFNVKPSTQLQAIVLLSGLHNEHLVEPIMHIRQSPNSIYSNWIVEGNTKYTLLRARTYCEQKAKYAPPVYKQTHYNRVHSDPTPLPTKTTTPTPSPLDANNLQQLQLRFKSELTAATNKQDCIFNWRNMNKKTCVFHPFQSHKFFQCNLTAKLCRECEQDHELHKAIHNSSEATKRLRAASQTTTPTGPNTNHNQPPVTQPHARRITQPPTAPLSITQPYNSHPTPPQSDYDSGSNISNDSSLNSTNQQIEPYLTPSLCRNSHISQSSITSILNPPKCAKTVRFRLDPSPQICQKLELKKIPTATASTAITDSGATDDMSNNKDLFEYIVPINEAKFALLGDDTTKLKIEGYGTMNYFINNKRIRRMGYYVPTLGTTLLSIKRHIQYAGCYFHAENNNATLAYPTHLIDIQTQPEFQIQLYPASHSTLPYLFDEQDAILLANTKRRKFNIIPSSQARLLPKTVHSKFQDTIRVKKLIPDAKLPSRATPGSAGFDVKSSHSTVIPPKSQMLVHTGLAMAVPTGVYLRIAPRSSLSLRGINVGAGVVDNDYRGEVKVILQNTTDTPYKINQHDRIAQFIFEKNSLPCLVLSKTLSNTHRGKGGFGSTDSKQLHLINRIKAKTAALQTIHQKNYFKTHKLSGSPDTYEDEILSTDLPINLFTKIPSSTPNDVPCLPTNSVNKSLPKSASYSKDFLNQSIGYYNNANFIKYLPTTGNNSVTIQTKDGPPLSDEGHTATMRSKRRNTKQPTKTYAYSDVWHMDIGFGPTSAIGGIQYCLMLIDKSTKFRHMYPLKNLTSSIPRALKKFLNDVGKKPALIRTDFDKKLIGSDARNFLDEKNIRIEAAPPKRQHQNGLVERAWQSVVIMARNWLKSALLPSKYWYFALKRAVEISNISPAKINNKITTPFEAVHHKKVDYRQLFPLFATSYIKQETSLGKHKNKWTSQSLKVICVGSCPDSDGLLFYHPHSKSVISCADNYKFNTYLPSGPQFNEEFDGRMKITTKSSMENIHTAPSHETQANVYFKDTDGNYHPANIVSQPFDENVDPYIIQIQKSGNIIHAMSTELHQNNPEQPISEDTTPSHMLPWLQNDSKITLLLPQFNAKPKQGFLLQSDADNEWYFVPGRSKRHPPIHLSQFITKALSMYHNKKLFRGWVNTRQAHAARQVRLSSNIISHMVKARHVSAKDLTEFKTPNSLLQHAKLIPGDKSIWDKSYTEEYEGLQALQTWEVITEDQYSILKKSTKVNILPTMAISVIKKDGNGNPTRAKYRIVVLGNFDNHGWEKHECFAPVLAQYELRLLLHQAVDIGCIPKQGDVSQAFCQAFLPEEEVTVCKPPPGCLHSPPSTYWKLLKSLYGMRRSPRHWYNLAHEILTSIGLSRSPNSPCLYSGIIVPNHPPLYLGLYVDDFIFFSKSPDVEQFFQNEFAKKVTKVTFTQTVDFFLGIKFDCIRHNKDSVTIHLSQAAFCENLLIQQNLHEDQVNSVTSPYRSGFPIDRIKNEAYDSDTQSRYTKTLQSIVGSLTWLSMSTRPDLSTVTNMLAKYVQSPSQGHLDAAKRILRYIKGTINKGITFSTHGNSRLAAFLKFPTAPKHPIALTDANWGPQDQSIPKPHHPPEELDLFKSRSLSGFILWGNGPIHWVSKRQSLTARSTAEAEIVATDECVKFLLHMRNVCNDLNITSFLFPNAIPIYNDNSACIKWSKNMTTKGLRYIQIRENAVREAIQAGIVTLDHIAGTINIADLFTKEDKDTKHFLAIRDILVQDVLTHKSLNSVTQPQSPRGVTNPNPSWVGSRPLRLLPSSHNFSSTSF